MEGSNIEWTDHTFNPVIGCVKVSGACANCYAEAYNTRWSNGENWGPGSPRRRTSIQNWNKPRRWNAALEGTGRRERVFCASLADVFEEHPDWIEPRRDLWELIRNTPHLDWLLLTKRPENLADMLPDDWGDGYPNVWLGTTVENQQRAEERIPRLLSVPARVRFLSMEPLLGPVDLSSWLWVWAQEDYHGDTWKAPRGDLHWVIYGGESGSSARPSHPNWFRSIRDQCKAYGVRQLFKQWGEWAPGEDVEANGTDWPGMYEDDPSDGGVPRHSWPDAEIRATAARLGRALPPGPVAGDTEVLRVNKKRAGRLLDGRTHDGVPDVG